MKAPTGSTRGAFSWSLGSSVVAGGVLFLQSIVAGHILGPAQYGSFALVQAIAMVLLVPFLAGIDLSTARALSRASDAAEQRSITGSALAAVIGCCFVFAPFLVFLADPLGRALNTPRDLVLASIVLGMLLAHRWLLERVLAGLQRFRAQAMARLAEAAANVITFGALAGLAGWRTYTALVVAYGVGAVVLVVVAARAAGTGPTLGLRFASATRARGLAPYARLMLGSYLFTTVLFQIDTLAVNRTLGTRELGIYTAYYTGSVFIALQLLLAITNVAYPMMSRTDDKAPTLRLIRRWLAPGMAAAIISVLLGVRIVLALFGSGYPFRWDLALLFACWAALIAANGLHAVIVNAHSARAAARELAFQPFRIVFLVSWFAAWIFILDDLTLDAAVAGMFLAEVLESANLLRVIRRYVLGEPADHSTVPVATSLDVAGERI